MKRGTPTHPKTITLAEELDCELLVAIGLLESLWHFTAQYARGGDIGKFTNRHIAAGVHWSGDPDKLIATLVSCRWLDPDETHRLLIHDWRDHADEAVRKALKRADKWFIRPTPAIAETKCRDEVSGRSVETKCPDKTPACLRPSSAPPAPSQRPAASAAAPDEEGRQKRPAPDGAPEGRRGGCPSTNGLVRLLTAGGVDRASADWIVLRVTPDRVRRIAEGLDGADDPTAWARSMALDQSRDNELTEGGRLDRQLKGARRSRSKGGPPGINSAIATVANAAAATAPITAPAHPGDQP